MVKTRLSTKKNVRTSPVKKLRKDNVVKKEKKNIENFDRCKRWIQQQKKEKPKCQPDELNSDESDEERQQNRLDTVIIAQISGPSTNSINSYVPGNIRGEKRSGQSIFWMRMATLP